MSESQNGVYFITTDRTPRKRLQVYKLSFGNAETGIGDTVMISRTVHQLMLQLPPRIDVYHRTISGVHKIWYCHSCRRVFFESEMDGTNLCDECFNAFTESRMREMMNEKSAEIEVDKHG